MCEVKVGDIVRSRTMKDLYNEYPVRNSIGIEELFIGDAPSGGCWVTSITLDGIAGREFEIIEICEFDMTEVGKGKITRYTLKSTVGQMCLDQVAFDNLIIA